GTHRQYRADGPALHYPATDRGDLPLAGRRSGYARLLFLRRQVDDRATLLRLSLPHRLSAGPGAAPRAARGPGLRGAPSAARTTPYPRCSGRSTVKVEPLPRRLSMVSRPRWRVTMCLTSDSPSPVPPSSRLRPTSTR